MNLLWKDLEWAYSFSGKNIFQKWIFKSLYWLLYVPLFIFYLAGPKWMGAWEGRNFTDICSYDTNIEAQYWSNHQQECKDHIQKLYHQWLSPLLVMGYLFILYLILSSFIIPTIKYLFKIGYEKVNLFANKILNFIQGMFKKVAQNF